MFMLAGPNGAGKSTLYERVIKPRVQAPFINADVIQRDELKDRSMTASYKAAEIAEQRRQEHLARRQDFVSESTFSHPSKLALIDQAKDAGFLIALYHVSVRSANLSVSRVAHRTEEGGHDVPEDKIRERYARNQALIREAMLKVDFGFVYDNSALNQHPRRLIDFERGQVVRVADNVRAWARELYAQELQRFSPTRLNPAAASFADAKALVERLAGEGATLGIPKGMNATSRGELVAETAQHWVQHAGDKEYVAHFKSALDEQLQLHKTYDISYLKVGKATVKALTPEAVQRSRDMAQAFRSMGEPQACAQFPELRGAYEAMRVLETTMPTRNAEAVKTARDQLARFVALDRVPPVALLPHLLTRKR